MALTASRPAPTHVIAHLSDPHLIAGGGLLAGHIDTQGQLRKALARAEGSRERIDALVISGDLTDTGDPAAYDLLLEIVGPVVERLGCALVLTGGNHDERRPVAQRLHGLDTDEPQDSVTVVARWSVTGRSELFRTRRKRGSPSCAARLRVRSTARCESQ